MKLTVDARYLIQIVAEGDPYPTARCALCASQGLLNNRLGYSYRAQGYLNRLVHTKACPIGKKLPKPQRERIKIPPVPDSFPGLRSAT